MPTPTSDEQRNWHRLTRHFNKGCVDYHLLADGDRILIGLSGGKDSMALLRLMAERARIFRPRIEVVAVHVVMSSVDYSSDLDHLARYAAALGVPFHVAHATFDAAREPDKSRCFLCSWHRRKAMFELARQLGCNKLALGHHMDDIIETMLMNLTFEGNFTTMRPLLRMKKFDLTVIRPLCLVHEADLKEFAVHAQLPGQIKKCPFDGHTNRSEMKAVLHQLEALNPEARYSLWHSMAPILNDDAAAAR